MKRFLVLLLVAGCSAPMTGPDGGLIGPDGGAVGGGRGGGTGGGSGGGTVTGDGGVAAAPEWVTVSAHVAGRTGRDLQLAVKGKDRNLDAVSVWVRLLDSVGGPVVGFDLNRDGSPEASEGSLPLDGKKWVSETVTATSTSRGLFATGLQVAQVGVKLVDATGLESDEQVIEVATQPVMAMGAPCDPTFVTSRCEQSLGCRGMPPLCVEGMAPAIGKLAFYRGANGPTILMEGTEPEDDLTTLRFTFQSATGQAISIDSDGDGQPDMASFDQDATSLAVDGVFFLRLQPSSTLDQQVPKLVVTPVDLAGHTGPAKTAAPSAIPVKSSGQPCDARGFDVCAPNLSCSPGIVGMTTNKCASAAPMRTSQCSAAPVLVPGGVVYGQAEGGSLWDAPSGCSSADPTGRPEGVVTLRLTSRVAHLTLSTIGPGTNFDSTLYVMPGCPNDNADALGCNDDFPNSAGASQLELTDVPPGDYVVVIDSFDQLGGAFELHATE